MKISTPINFLLTISRLRAFFESIKLLHLSHNLFKLREYFIITTGPTTLKDKALYKGVIP